MSIVGVAVRLFYGRREKDESISEYAVWLFKRVHNHSWCKKEMPGNNHKRGVGSYRNGTYRFRYCEMTEDE